eukprot:2235642-Prymnesium_polylepis.1
MSGCARCRGSVLSQDRSMSDKCRRHSFRRAAPSQHSSQRAAPSQVVECEEGGCPFDQLFEQTPSDLIAAGLYRPIALQWFLRGGYNAISLALVAKRL